MMPANGAVGWECSGGFKLQGLFSMGEKADVASTDNRLGRILRRGVIGVVVAVIAFGAAGWLGMAIIALCGAASAWLNLRTLPPVAPVQE